MVGNGVYEHTIEIWARLIVTELEFSREAADLRPGGYIHRELPRSEQGACQRRLGITYGRKARHLLRAELQKSHHFAVLAYRRPAEMIKSQLPNQLVVPVRGVQIVCAITAGVCCVDRGN